MKPELLKALTASLAAALIAGCGGNATSVATASASNARFGQTMVITFNGQGLDQELEAGVDGPCETLTRIAGGTANTLQYTCVVNGVGTITPYLAESGGKVLASVKVDIPLPRVNVNVNDGTRNGTITLELDPVAAPATTAQFLAYATAGFYTNTLFHRVRPAVAILGGGYIINSDGLPALKTPTRSAIPLERTGLSNQRGTIALYHDQDPGSGNSQFFINTVDNPQFDPGSSGDGFAVFGKVVDGMAMVESIAAVPAGPNLVLGLDDSPLTPVRITSVTQTR